MNRILYQSPTIAVGQFVCPPHDRRWHDVNVNGETFVAAFPGTSVVIQHAGRLPVLANPNHVVFYAPGERYRRAMHDSRGDRCFFVCLHSDAAPEVLESLGLDPDRRLPFAAGPSDPDAHIVLRVAVRALLAGTAQLLAIEEAAHYALAQSLAVGARLHWTRRDRVRAFTEREHHRLVEEAKALLTERVSEHDSLVVLAHTLSTSPFHLARVFRERTGFSLHGYRMQLRLRLALDRLAESAVAVQSIARDLGFSSHAHFSHAFKETFGVSPSALRSVSDVRALRAIARPESL